MTNNRKWKKVEPPTAWNFEENKELVGTYLEVAEGIGENESNLYSIRLADGTVASVWGSKILDVRLKNIEPGEEVRIVYKGVKKTIKGGRTYHDFDVYHRMPPMEKVADNPEAEVNPEEVPL